MTTTAAVLLRSTIPARLDRLSWSAPHTRMVAGIKAEGQSLETVVTKPLSAVEATPGTVTTNG